MSTLRSDRARSRFGDERSCDDNNTGRSRGDPSGHDDGQGRHPPWYVDDPGQRLRRVGGWHSFRSDNRQVLTASLASMELLLLFRPASA